MDWTLAMAVVLVILLLSDLVSGALLLIVAAGRAGHLATSVLRTGFFAALFCLVSMLALFVFVPYFDGDLMWSEGTIVFLCVSAMLTGLAGYAALSSSWRFGALSITLLGLFVLILWYLRWKPMFFGSP